MAKIAPIAKTVFLCDDVVRDQLKRKTSILNMLDTVRLNIGDTFPFRLEKLCVFSELSDGYGDFSFHVETIRLDTMNLLSRTKQQSFRFVDRLKNVQVLFRLVDCRFPNPGDYTVRLFCEEEMIGDRVLHVLS